ncbi:uncharacterized protein LOC120328907 isoform X1 [Styela clava]
MIKGHSKTWLHQGFLEKIIKNDIPHEELENLGHKHTYNKMDFHSPTYEHFDTANANPEDFHSEEYMEYRRRVFQELASEYDKYGNTDKQQPSESKLISNIPREYTLSDIQYPLSPTQDYSYSNSLHSVSDFHEDDPLVSFGDLSPSQQPVWDDSDLQPEQILPSPSLKKTSEITSSDQRTNLISFSKDNNPNDKMSLLHNEENSWYKNTSEEDHRNNEDIIPSMHWTELEKQLEVLTKHHEEQTNLKQQSPEIHRTFSPPSKRRSRTNLQKQKNDREAMLQKLSKGDPDIDSVPFGSDKPWYQPRLERSYSGNNQNLQICYINNSCSSSDSEEAGTDSKTSPSSMGKSSTSSPVLSSPGFGTRRNLPSYRMSSSSSTVSLSSTSSAGHHNSSSSLPGDGEIINIRPSINTDDIPKPKTKQEQLELQARIAITQAHQEARRLAAEERRRNRKGSNASTDRLLNVPLDDATRLKVKTRSLSRDDCHNMTDGQLQVILNNMHAEKEALNDELKVILELRDDLRTEQDAKLIDVDDYKAMLSATGPETTV